MAWVFNPFTGTFDYTSSGGGGGTNPRVVTLADSNTVTINCDTTDMAIMANTQVAGSMTINAPTGTPVDGQKLVFRISTTNSQNLSTAWNAIFAFSTDIPQPTATSGSSKYDYFGFMYNAAAVKWQLVSNIMGF